MEKSGDTDLIVISDHITDQQHGLDTPFVPLSFCVFHCKPGTVEVPLGYCKDYIHPSFSWLIKSSDFWLSYYIPLFWASRKTLVSKKRDGAFPWEMCSFQFSSVAQLCPTLCDPMNRSMPRLPVHHHLLEFTQTHVHQVSDAIQPSHPRSSPSPPAPNPSQHQSLFQWVNSLHEVAKVLEFQL